MKTFVTMYRLALLDQCEEKSWYQDSLLHLLLLSSPGIKGIAQVLVSMQGLYP